MKQPRVKKVRKLVDKEYAEKKGYRLFEYHKWLVTNVDDIETSKETTRNDDSVTTLEKYELVLPNYLADDKKSNSFEGNPNSNQSYGDKDRKPRKLQSKKSLVSKESQSRY